MFGRLAGYEDVNDAERLRHDPAMRWVVGGKAALGAAASPSQMGRFETCWLTAEKNLSALADLSGRWIDCVHDRRAPRGIVLDMDSSVSPTHGDEEMSVWNGHYARTCYHPLFVFNQFGDLERCALRPGNVHSADGFESALEPIVARYRCKFERRYFRADAAFANPEVYEFLEAEDFRYAIRLPANRILQERIGHLLKRPVSRIIWLFSLVLGHSRHIFARFVLHQDLQTLLRGHMAAFEAIGGVPVEILYDRMKTAVTGQDGEGHIVYNRSLLALAQHYGFLPKACRPYRAKTKGKVERPFRYIREDFFLGRSFRDMDDLNRQLADWLATVANVRLHGTTNRIVADAFAAEQPELQALPAGPFDALIKLERRVSHDGFVAIGGNYYSVPDRTRRLVEVHQLAHEIRILDAGRLVARHPVMEGRKQYLVDPAHRQGNAARTQRHGFPHRREEEGLTFLRPGEQVASRSLAIYQAIGDRLAAAGAGGRP